MERSISRIYTFRGSVPTMPPVQLLVLKAQAGCIPEDIVRHFDLTLLQRWFDGQRLVVLPEAREALEQRQLVINVSSDIREQTMSEWVRTARRLHKYTERNFEIQWQSDPVDTLLLQAAADGIYKPWIRTLELQTLEMWNMQIRALGSSLPYLVVTVCPPATSIVHIRIVRTMNNRLFMNAHPRLHWSELTNEERESALPIQVPSNQQRNRVVRVRRMSRHNNWAPNVFEKENVATLIQFPLFEVRSQPILRSTTLFSMAMAEEMDSMQYLAMNPKDHIIILDPQGKKFGLLRSQLLATPTYLACPTPESMNMQDVIRKGFISYIPLTYNVYIPQEQLLAALKSSFVYFGVYPMNVRFDYTVSMETLEGGTYVSANHCQAGTDKQLWNLYAIRTPE
jgi:hypothetical protein